jgi:pimeloyl-ACP methyl ester carboxylesterase
MKITPFTVNISDARLEDMRRRIRATSWPGDFANEEWRYGVEEKWLGAMAAYWADEYDWRATEAAINRFPNFMADIDGVPIHFIHLRSPRPNAIPLILTHGWPWTFWDWRYVIEPLANGEPGGPVFDVVVPSLPGYGLSAPLRTAGLGARQVATLWVKLMREGLGYDRFAAAGGDFGTIITGELGHGYPQHLIGVNLTTPALAGMDWYSFTREMYAPDEQWMIERTAATKLTIAGHMAVNVHDSQTIAYALADSPVGTAAWLWERRRAWSDCDDIIAYQGRDFLCDLASIYWLPNTVGSAMRIYAEHFRRDFLPLNDRKPMVPVPTGCMIAPKDLIFVPKTMAEKLVNLRRWTILERGGHFSPSEVPELVVAEYRTFFGALGQGNHQSH